MTHDIGIYSARQSRLASVLATASQASRDRITGKKVAWQEASVTWIEVNLKTGARTITQGPQTAPTDDSGEESVNEAPPNPAPVAPPPAPRPQDGPPAPARPYPETVNPFDRPKATKAVLRAAASVWGVTEIELVGVVRTYRLAHPRSAIYTVLREFGWPFQKVGHAVGKRDHSTAISGARRFRFNMQTPDFASKYALFRAALGLEPRSPDASL